ncbi:MAG: hypothetical protein H0W30_19580 [Gemmatimonadaceae bacterium]|nr:hypothetical protein [Gemmatimonadaceae bacterium]
MRRIADRKDEFTLFERMLRGAAPNRVLLLEGPSERGKSILLAELALLAEEILGQRCCARTDLKGGLALDELFSGFLADLGPEVFANYTKQPAPAPLQVNVEANLSGAEFGDGNKVAVQPIIHTGAPDSAHHRGKAILQDLRTCTKPLVLIIDTFEAATDEASRWIVQQLLPSVRHNVRLSIVLGGQRVPDPRDSQLTWGGFADRRILKLVTSVDDWHEFACSCHPAFPRQHIESVLRGLVHRPSIIQEFIENIVRQLPPRNAGEALS